MTSWDVWVQICTSHIQAASGTFERRLAGQQLKVTNQLAPKFGPATSHAVGAQEQNVTRLKVDTWDSEYGSSFEALDLDPDDAPGTARQIESERWAPIIPLESSDRIHIGFIDGVRRIDSRLFAEDESGIAPALVGSWAVGVAWADRPPTIGSVRVGRELVVGGELKHADLRIAIGATDLEYKSTSVPGNTPIDPIQGLQNAMRLAESQLVADLFAKVESDLIVQDGPLTYFAPAGPIVGMIKRQNRPYLNADQAPILAALQVG